MKNLFPCYRLVMSLLIFLCLSLTACGTGSDPTSIPDQLEISPVTDLELLWSDEFTGASLDSSKWNVETGMTGWGNNEWQNYTDNPENLKVENGNLVITARCDSGVCGDKDGSITSSRINTKGKFSAQYGSIQARIKAPAGQGMWAAFWMMGANFDSVGWPECGEVDIMEIFDGASTNDRVHTVLHWSDGGHVFEGDSRQFPSPLSDDFHTYEVDWNENRIIGKVDGRQFFVRTINPTAMDEFLNDFFILLNVAVGGNLGAVPVTNQVWQHEMLVDWVRVYGEVLTPTPPAGDTTTAGIYTETAYDTTLSYSRIINSADWAGTGGDNVVVDENNNTVTPTEGSVALSATFENNPGTTFSGVVFDFGSADFSGYSVLSLSVDSTEIADFNDMKIELEDGSAKGSVQLVDYTPVVSNNWATYRIPLSNFSAVNLTAVSLFGLYNPVDSSGNRFAGTLYFDDIYLDAGCVDTGEVLFHSGVYPADTLSTTFNVSDLCAAESTISVDIDNGTDTISVDVVLDAGGNGTSPINFGTTDDATDTIAIASGDSLTATFSDAKANQVTDTATITAAGVPVLAGDAPVADGAVYVYATNMATVIDLVEDTDYTKTTWDSGATHDMAFVDTTYGPVISVTPGNGWDPSVYSGAVAFSEFTQGFAASYSTLHFKFKGDYSSVLVKFANGVPGPDQENEYRLSSANAENLGNGWYELSFRLSDYLNLAAYSEFAVLNFGTTPFYLTDIYFE